LDKQHAFQIGINADVDDIEAAAERAALAVNRYLETVVEDIGAGTQVVVSIGSGAAAQDKPYRTNVIGFLSGGDDDDFDFDEFEDEDDEEVNHD
jgi:hypothetical protein